MQELVPWAEAESVALSTNNEMPLPVELVLKSVLSAWQSRQSLSFSAADALRVARARTSNANGNKILLTIPHQHRVKRSNFSTLFGDFFAFFADTQERT